MSDLYQRLDIWHPEQWIRDGFQVQKARSRILQGTLNGADVHDVHVVCRHIEGREEAEE